MSEPSIVSSGKPHTVSLPEGSTVAAQRRPQRVSASLPADLPEMVRLGEAPEGSATGPMADRERGPQAAAEPDAGLAAAAGAGPATPQKLDDALLARIADLERRNARVRAALDRTSP